ncbi:MAG: beta-galactosidase, partial [Candidatus Hydrogenedentes bacterium]|nr:beta-galactosidase [Candidatus Hydrogenedentota bacterium]
PRRKATGWFRTEEIDGKWWLITPEGTLFFSLGITCIGTWERTFVEGRKDWFEWLPPEDDPVFGSIYSTMKGAHSMADPIGGSGKTFGFYTANLIRKYGKDWAVKWQESVYPRLNHWGFNTIANWSQEDVLRNSTLPFVASTGLNKVRLIESARGYWRKMMDVYDSSFEENVDAAAKYIATKYGDNPLCIGYYVDNELAWEGVIEGVLSSVPEQPARQALLDFLQKRYAALEDLNSAWNISLESWDALDNAAATSTTARKDMSDFLYAFAHQYFSVIQNAIKVHAPNQLYLGCRFASAPDEAVRACADVADMVSCNLYYPSIPADKYAGKNSLGKPVIIGEFHFGALDRGMFHTGLVGAKDQADRAAQYKRYVRSVADNPSFVGCHWFQYIDEP